MTLFSSLRAFASLRFNYVKYLCFLLIFLSAQISSEEPENLPKQSLAISPAAFEKRLSEHIHYNPSGPNVVGRILIEDRSSGITQATWLYVKQALEHYKKTKPIFVILELNTPGGEVFAAQQIANGLKDLDIQEEIPVVAYINNWAISAGAMLAYSSRFIVIAKDASMGAAEPILASQTGEVKEASEKINSALRSEFANRASFFGRNPYIAEAMVDKDIILVMREGKIIKLDSDAKLLATDTLISPKGKLLTLNAEQLIHFGVADQMISPEKLPSLTEEERVLGKWPGNKSALFHQSFFSQIPQVTIDTYQMDWKTQFFVFLANPVVSSLLMLGMMMGFYIEMNTPGFGFAGTIAVVCLILIVLSSLSLQIANWLEVILLLTGIAIVVIDLFVLPTFGLLGFIGIAMAIGGLFAIMLPEIGSIDFDFDTNTINAAGQAFLNHLAWLSATLVLGILLILILARYMTPRFAAWSRLVLSGGEQEGYIASEDPKKLPPVGTQGEAMTPLRPAGKIVIEDAIYDALTEGSYIERGSKIVISRLDGSIIIVSEIQERIP